MTDRIDHDAQAAVPPARTTVTLAIFALLFALSYLDRRILTLLIDPIKASLHATDFQMGLLQGFAFVLFFVACAIPIGWAVDRYSRRVIIFIGLVIWSSFATAGGLAQSYAQLLVTRFGVGAGEASLQPAVHSTLADLVPRDRLTRALAIFSIGGIIGAALSVGVGGVVIGMAEKAGGATLPLIGHIEPWQLVLIVTGLPGLLLAGLVFLAPEPKRAPHHHAGKNGYLAAFTHMACYKRFYISHFVAFSVVGLIAAGFNSWAPTAILRLHHEPVERVGTVLAAIQMTFGVAGMLIPGHFVDRMFRAGYRDAHLRYYLGSVIILALAGVAFGAARNAVMAYAAVALFDLAVGFFPVAGSALQVTTPSRYRGQVTATFLMVYYIFGQGFGPAVVASFGDFVFHGDKTIGLSIAATCAAALPVSVIAFLVGMKGMTEAEAAMTD
ncbi:MAG: MFS transporter [Sphingomonas bacterium]